MSWPPSCAGWWSALGVLLVTAAARRRAGRSIRYGRLRSPCSAAASWARWASIAGIWADKFDQLAAFQNFVIVPLTFLAGVFYSVHSLPAVLAEARPT